MQQQGRVVEAPIADRISRAGKPLVFPWKDIQPVSTSTCDCMAQHLQSKVGPPGTRVVNSNRIPRHGAGCGRQGRKADSSPQALEKHSGLYRLGRNA